MFKDLTLSPAGRKNTPKTRETLNVSNQHFLKGVFHSLPASGQIAVVSFPGNPANGNWTARPADTPLADTFNNYFAVSSYFLDTKGKLTRSKKSFAAMHCLMLDDIGTKINPDKITLPASWKLETSPGNFQVGYILETPITDPTEADRFMKVVIDAGLCDPGAGGPTARLARLPVGINGKYEESPACRLDEWHPTYQYTTQQILDHFGLTLPTTGRPKPNAGDQVSRASAEFMSASNDVFKPVPLENPVLAALKLRGLYKANLGGGKHDITCPWVHEHTDQADGGTAYFEPDDGFPIGGFKCFHSHGDRLHIREFLEFLKVEGTTARMKPTIRIMLGRIDSIVDKTEELLAETGHYYQSAGLIASIETDPATLETSIKPLSQNALLRVISRVADWERYDKRSESWVVSDPPVKYNNVLYDAVRYPHLPYLSGLARQPHLREDGSLVINAGYDPVTKLYGVFEPEAYCIPKNPTREDAEAALQMLLSLVEECAFAEEIDRAAAISAMLTAAVRPSLDLAPGFHVVAHAYGSGKSFLTRLIGALATPQNVPGIAFLKDADEMRKTLIALLIKSPAVINFDDMSSDIEPSEALKTALTEEYIGGRLLGVSKDVTCSTRSLFLFSGNNVFPVKDMARRVISIHLDPQCENPITREFKRPNLGEQIRKDRAFYVSAALTVITAWIAAGKPKAEVKAFQGYNGQWADWCRHPLIWLGMEDPIGRIWEQMTNDPDAEMLGKILLNWYGLQGERPAKLRDMRANRFSYVTEAVELEEYFWEIAGHRDEINYRVLGHWFKRQQGRLAHGLKLVREENVQKSERWRVIKVSNSVSIEPFQYVKNTKFGDLSVVEDAA